MISRAQIAGTLAGALTTFLLTAILISVLLLTGGSSGHADVGTLFWDAVLIVVIEGVAYLFVRFITRPGNLRKFLVVTFLSLMAAALIMIFVLPSSVNGLGFDELFLIVWGIHIVGYAVMAFGTRNQRA